MKMKLIALAMTSALATSLVGCGGDDDKKDSALTKVLKTNANIAHAAYSDSVDTAEELKSALATFKAEPTEANLTAAKNAWLTAREPYGQTEVYRFRETPIDDDIATADDNEDGPEGAINAWPLGEALIDYVELGTDFGDEVAAENTVGNVSATVDGSDATDNIIANTDVTLDAALLAKSESGDGADVISGYHAIEFILWGQDLNTVDGADSKGMRDATGGQRPVSDFFTDSGCTNGEGNAAADTTPCKRRHEFMAVVVDQLISDLEGVRDQWANDGQYRKEFLASGETGLLEILTGMGTLAEGELAGERMKIALNVNSQEDEHSCFSDNTHRDIWLNAEGVSNSYYGDYAGYDSTQNGKDDQTGRAITGYGLDAYLRANGQEAVAKEIEEALAKTATAYTAIDTDARNGKPFDNVIEDKASPDAANVKATIVALNQEAQLFKEAAKALGLDETKVIQEDASDCNTADANVSDDC